MSLKQILTAATVAAMLGMNVAGAAGIPGNVKNVQAGIVDGKLTVTWEYPGDIVTVASFRVYFSHQSILANDGNYDDFEQTTGPVQSYTFATPPLPSPAIFLGVLAVAQDGTESDGFEVETKVFMPEASSSSIAQSSAASVPSEAVPASLPPPSPLIITTAEPQTDTGILLTVNKPLGTSPEADGFEVTESGGTALTVTAVYVPDPLHILLVTSLQKPDTSYGVQLLRPLIAQDGGSTESGMEPLRLHTPAVIVASAPSIASEPSVPPPAEKTPPVREYGRNPALPIANVTGNSVTVPVPAKTALPGSGLGLMGIIALAGAVAGSRAARRKMRT